MAIDLTGPRASAEAVLFGIDADECVIYRRPAAPATTFNETTGQYTLPTPAVVYTGVCSLKSNLSVFAGRGMQGMQDVTQQRWNVTLPVPASAADPPRPGDVVVMTLSRDGAWTGDRFVVRDAGGGTNSVLRRIMCDRWEPGAGQDWLRPSP